MYEIIFIYLATGNIEHGFKSFCIFVMEFFLISAELSKHKESGKSVKLRLESIRRIKPFAWSCWLSLEILVKFIHKVVGCNFIEL